MAMREAQIDALATHLVNGLIDRGLISPKADAKELVACVVELMSANFETEAQIDEEADKMAEAEARRDTRLDVTRLRRIDSPAPGREEELHAVAGAIARHYSRRGSTQRQFFAASGLIE